MATAWRLEHEEVIDEVEALGLLIRDTDSSLLAFALYRSVAERDAAVQALKQRLEPAVVEFTLSKERKDPVSLLHTLPVEERICIFFYDVEEALPDAAGYLNLQREAFAEVPHAAVFWVGEQGLREIAVHAPDFWAWRSGVFDFRSEQFERPMTAMRMALAEPLLFQDRGDLDRRISLYQGLIVEHGRQETPDESFLARLEMRLVSAFHILGHLDEAEAHAHQALERGWRSGNQETEAIALGMIGVLALQRGRVDEAEESLRKGLAIGEQIGNEEMLASSYYDLGMVAQERQRFDEAEEWHRKALEIFERLGLERDAADEYYQLGMIALERQRLDEAEEWHRKALEIRERLGLERDAAYEYHQLGTIAQERQRLDEAEDWYRKALEIRERLGLERDAAYTYHQLGMNAQERRRFNGAEDWYRKALEVHERLGLERYAAYTYHQLGRVAQERQRLDEAEVWYRKALEIFERLGHPPLMVKTLAQLGTLRRLQNRPGEAVSSYGRALSIAAEYNMRVGHQIQVELAGVMKDMGEEDFTTAWRQALDGQEPPIVALREVLEKPGS